MKILDANMILRYLIRDNEDMAQKVVSILKSDKVYILPEVIAEVVYVLTGVYKISREDTATAILRFLNISNVNANQKNIIEKGLIYFSETSLDFVDCILCAYHTEAGYEICTFDKKLIKLIEKCNEK